jgi:hypothetical protein
LGLFGRHEQRGGAEDSAGVARLGGEEEGAEKEQCLVAGHKGAKERRGERRRSEGERHAAAVVGLRSERARGRGVDEHAGVARLGGEEEGAEKEQCLVAGHKGPKERREGKAAVGGGETHGGCGRRGRARRGQGGRRRGGRREERGGRREDIGGRGG